MLWKMAGLRGTSRSLIFLAVCVVFSALGESTGTHVTERPPTYDRELAPSRVRARQQVSLGTFFWAPLAAGGICAACWLTPLRLEAAIENTEARNTELRRQAASPPSAAGGSPAASGSASTAAAACASAAPSGGAVIAVLLSPGHLSPGYHLLCSGCDKLQSTSYRFLSSDGDRTY